VRGFLLAARAAWPPDPRRGRTGVRTRTPHYPTGPLSKNGLESMVSKTDGEPAQASQGYTLYLPMA